VAVFFNETKWRTAITKHDWYIVLYPELKEMRRSWEVEPETQRTVDMKFEVRNFFETALRDGSLALATSGPNLDKERKAIDTIVIHHTSAKPGYRLSHMNAVQLLNVYVPYFNNPSESIPGEKRLKGEPLWSNHVRGGQPVFYLYHWLMRMDGSFERLLKDNELGWHAANWGINCRSVAICLDNDYDQRDPSPEVLQKLADFIRNKYPRISIDRIFGHGEVSVKGTTCPGKDFAGGWKKQLLAMVQQS
jgi:N-acetylmuramoyl-L-alanine amidase